jgi:glycosyltransferase involved in cell wall biosynthesis
MDGLFVWTDREEIRQMNQPERTPVSAVLLTFNEGEVIEGVVREVCEKVVAKLPGSELIVAEDGSTDGTAELLRKLAESLPIRLVQGEERKGYTRALRDALALPERDLVFFSDSSGKQDPKDFWKLYEAIEGADMVIGYKHPRRDPFYRIVLTRVFNFLVNRYFGVRFRDINSGFRLMRRGAVQRILRDEWRMRHLISFELTLRMALRGLAVKEVPVSHRRREHGPSRGLPLKKIPEAVFQVLRAFPAIRRDCAPDSGSRESEGIGVRR